jgi:hypothetical protein
MKKTLITALLMGIAAGAFAQGTVTFANNNGNSVLGPLFRANMFLPETGDSTVSKTGQTGGTDNPVGTQTYTGAFLTTGYRAQLYAFNGASQAEGALLAAPAIQSFRSGGAAGLINSQTATLVGVPLDAAVATIQFRVWDNTSGLYPDWASAEPAWLNGTIAAGKSALLNINSIGGTLNAPPVLASLQSFNAYTIGAVPEPSTFVLAGLGAAGLLIFRRRK